MARAGNDPRAQAEWLAGVAEPTRLAVLRALAIGDNPVTELAPECGAEVVSVSHQLGLVKKAGLVVAARGAVPAVQPGRRHRDREPPLRELRVLFHPLLNAGDLVFGQFAEEDLSAQAAAWQSEFALASCNARAAGRRISMRGAWSIAKPLPVISGPCSWLAPQEHRAR